MAQAPNIDGVLIQLGDRLFYPRNRIVKVAPDPRLKGNTQQQRAAVIRDRIAATVRRAPQVMVKVTGGGRGMKAIAAHFRYISKNGRLDIEDERGQKMSGKDALPELADDWRYGGSLIEDQGSRREAFNIMLSMPRGTDPLIVLRAAREFAQADLADRENRADLVGGVSLDTRDDTLAAVLLDLSQGATMEASNAVAGQVHASMRRVGPTHKAHVERANFMVLRSPDVPSILVETAFISNPAEERRLKNPAERAKLAEAILDGIRNYFRMTPPPGTWFAQEDNRIRASRHVVRRI